MEIKRVKHLKLEKRNNWPGINREVTMEDHSEALAAFTNAIEILESFDLNYDQTRMDNLFRATRSDGSS